MGAIALRQTNRIATYRFAQPGRRQPLTRVDFRVPAFAGRTFTGNVARIDRSLDPKTRTMAVELDVANPRNQLFPGMFPEVSGRLMEAESP